MTKLFIAVMVNLLLVVLATIAIFYNRSPAPALVVTHVALPQPATTTSSTVTPSPVQPNNDNPKNHIKLVPPKDPPPPPQQVDKTLGTAATSAQSQEPDKDGSELDLAVGNNATPL